MADKTKLKMETWGEVLFEALENNDTSIIQTA